jgi:hypothetical protein
VLHGGDEAALENVLKRVQSERQSHHVLILIETHYDVVRNGAASSRTIGEHVFGFDLYDAQSVEATHRAHVQRLITALTLQTGHELKLRPVLHGNFAREGDTRTYYSFTFKFHTPTITVSRCVDSNGIAALSQSLESRPDLARAAGLLVDSALHEEPFGIWRSAWTGLELFVTKRFPYFEELLYSQLKANQTTVVTEFLQNRRERTPTLRDCFRVIAAMLFPAESQTDVAFFNKAKKARDEALHTGSDPADAEMAYRLRAMLRRYLEADLKHPKK